MASLAKQQEMEQQPAAKRKRLPALTAVNASMSNPHGAASAMTNLRHAEDYLKEKHRPLTFAEIAGFLSLQHAPPSVQSAFRGLLIGDLKVRFDSAAGGTFTYKPTLPFDDAGGMSAYLRAQACAGGVKIEDVRDGWPACLPEIDRMARDREVLLLRDRRGLAKAVHADDPGLWPLPQPAEEEEARGPIPVELVAWSEVKLPRNPDDLRGKLTTAGLKATMAAKQKAAAMNKVAKRKANKRSGRTTNTHIQHLLKDYSHKRS